jgi:putative protease
MTISSPEAARFAADLGVRRVVLPRELSVREIGAFLAGTDLEAEVFVHGALCVSWSGQCLTSEAWGGRSANRGQCAQSCRMPYDLVVDGAARDLGDVRYLLSPKDLAGLRAVPELSALGVHGLKIEGRQKGPQYVATAVAGYRRWVDAVADGRAATAATTLRDDLLAMSLSFSRGFGDGFLAGSDHQSLVEGRFPKHRGVYVGRVSRVERNIVWVMPENRADVWTGARAMEVARPSAPAGEVTAPLAACGGPTHAATGPTAAKLELRAGLGIVFDAGDPENKAEPGGTLHGVELQGGRIGLRFGKPGPDLRHVAPGQRVWATQDAALAQATVRLLKQTPPAARAAISLQVEAAAGEPLRVLARCGERRITIESSSRATRAHGEGLNRTLLVEKLGAFGGTAYALAALDATRVAPGLHVPVSELKELRRRIVAALDAAAPVSSPAAPDSAGDDTAAHVVRLRASFAVPAPDATTPVQLVALCRNDAQLDAALEVGLPEVELDWMERVGVAAAVQRARAAGRRVTLATLRVQKPGEEAFDAALARLEPDAFLVRHWGGLVHGAPDAGRRPRLHGDFSLNVTNSITARMLLARGLDTVTAAHDLDEAQLFALLEQVPAARVAVVVHHRIATFHTEHCVYSHLLSAGRDHRTCGRPCEQHAVSLRDHLGHEHPVIVDAGCRNTVFNAGVQTAAGLVPRLLQAGVRRYRVEFVRESRPEAARVLAAYLDLLAGRIRPSDLQRQLDVRPQQGVGRAPMQLLA